MMKNLFYGLLILLCACDDLPYRAPYAYFIDRIDSLNEHDSIEVRLINALRDPVKDSLSWVLNLDIEVTNYTKRTIYMDKKAALEWESHPVVLNKQNLRTL